MCARARLAEMEAAVMKLLTVQITPVYVWRIAMGETVKKVGLGNLKH